MKRLLLKKIMKFYRLNFPSSREILLVLVFSLVLLSGFQSTAQPQLPVVTVRYANPQYDCPTQTYCLDVEFLSDTPGLQVDGMNVRFFYDDNVLEYLSMGDFQEGYDSTNPPEIVTGLPGSGVLFGLAGPLEWFNGTVQLVSPSPIFLSTVDTIWTKLFNVCFHVDDPNALDTANFCPSIVWDLQVNPESGGYFPGDDGVVIIVVTSNPQELLSTTENVVQFNWVYDATENLIGYPVSIICISTICGYVIPLSNWALFLAIGLMLVASVFIYRRRMNS